jgi:hypothetical protein
MKLSSRLEVLKRQQQTRHRARGFVRTQPGKRRSWRWAMVAACLVLAGVGTWAVLENFVWTKIPPALVGQWEVTGGPMSGGTFSFSRNGSLAIQGIDQGSTYAINSRTVVVGKTLLMTSQDPNSGQEQTRKCTIQELTVTSLVLELEGGQVLRLVRKR